MGTRLAINPANLDFDLPANLIAQEPLVKRDEARLMILNRQHQSVSHGVFHDIVGFLNPNDVLVLNKAKVNQTKVIGRKKTGGRVELIFIIPTAKPNEWKALVRPFLQVGTEIFIGDNHKIVVSGKTEYGENMIDFGSENPSQLMAEFGQIPLPPYIKRNDNDARALLDQTHYQTIYASAPGSIAAPTAGLHFTQELLTKIRNKGVSVLEILLHVGWGTFKPVHDVDKHVMLPESYEISVDSIDQLYAAKKNKKRFVAVGTTVTRVLESLPVENPKTALSGQTNLFIKPGFTFQWVSALITNFHVPRSTPISLVSAFAGLPLIETAYSMAIDQNYRFFSYGDAMLIE